MLQSKGLLDVEGTGTKSATYQKRTYWVSRR